MLDMRDGTIFSMGKSRPAQVRELATSPPATVRGRQQVSPHQQFTATGEEIARPSKLGMVDLRSVVQHCPLLHALFVQHSVSEMGIYGSRKTLVQMQ